MFGEDPVPEPEPEPEDPPDPPQAKAKATNMTRLGILNQLKALMAETPYRRVVSKPFCHLLVLACGSHSIISTERPAIL